MDIRQTDRQTDKQTDISTLLLTRPESVKMLLYLKQIASKKKSYDFQVLFITEPL